MNASEIRQKFLEYQISLGHEIIAPAPLVLENDPTTLFTGSGMQPLLPYLLGQPHPKGTRLSDSQPSLRLQDIEDVGDPRHTTVFEMLGNWSLGDYFKKEQIPAFFNFLTKIVGLDPNKIYVTCFIGNEKYGIPKDIESAEIWQRVFKEAGVDAKIAEIGSAEEGAKRGINDSEVVSKLPQLAILVAQIPRCFMISAKISKMSKNTANHIPPQTAPVLWKLATKSSCNIKEMRTAVLLNLKRKMLTLALGLSGLLLPQLTPSTSLKFPY